MSASPGFSVERRQVLLGVAGVVLLSGCASTARTAKAAADTTGTQLRGESHTSPIPGPDEARIPGTLRPEYYVHAGHKGIALTIDDGPDPRYTPQVLAILEQHHISATFCMIGSSAKAYPALVREVIARGHHIANHTWSHPDLVNLSAASVRDQILRAEEAVHTASGGYRPTVFRAPYGAWDQSLLALCERMKLRALDWSVDPRDWSRPGTSQIVDTVLHTTRTGSIILEHDGGGDRSQTVAALRVFLPRLLSEGYHFVQP